MALENSEYYGVETPRGGLFGAKEPRLTKTKKVATRWCEEFGGRLIIVKAHRAELPARKPHTRRRRK